MRKSKFASRADWRVGAAILVLTVLTGCAGRELGELQSDLESLQRRSVEQRRIRELVNNSSFVVSPESTPVDLASDYLVLAASAGKQAGVGSVRPDTQIAFHRVRGIAAWRAAAESVGRSPAALTSARSEADAARNQGGALCKTLGEAAPPRDCAVLALLPSLVELELASGTWIEEQVPVRSRALVDQADRDAPFSPAISAFHGVANGNDVVARALRARGFAPWLCAIYQGIETNARARWFAVSAVPAANPDGVTVEAANTARLRARENWRAFVQTRAPTECQPPPS